MTKLCMYILYCTVVLTCIANNTVMSEWAQPDWNKPSLKRRVDGQTDRQTDVFLAGHLPETPVN